MILPVKPYVALMDQSTFTVSLYTHTGMDAKCLIGCLYQSVVP